MFTLFLIGFVTFLIYFYYKNKFNYWLKRGIKGPKAYPILGTFLEESKLQPKETEVKFLKEYGPVYGTYFNTTPVLNTSRIEDFKIVLNDLQTFPSQSVIGFFDKYLSKSMFFKNGLDWKTVRAAQTHYFTGKKFRSLLHHFEHVTKNFMENLEDALKKSKSNELEVKQLSKYYSIDCISKVLFAIDVNSYKERNSTYVKSASEIGDIIFYQAFLMTILPTPVSKFLQLQVFNFKPIQILGDYFKRLIKERKKTGIKYNDLTEVLENSVNENKVILSEDEVIGNILLSYFAGVEAVANSIANLLYLLSENPVAQTKLYNEIIKEFNDGIEYEKLTQNEYLDAVINESLRFGTSFLMVTRTAAIDTKLGEYPIEKGTEIRLMTYTPNTKSDYYMDPRAFIPERFLKGSNESKNEGNLFIPFGYGPKTCLGQRLALLEMKFLCVNLLKKYELCKAKDSGYQTGYVRGLNTTVSINVAFKERL